MLNQIWFQLLLTLCFLPDMRLNPRKRPSKPPIWGNDSICYDTKDNIWIYYNDKIVNFIVNFTEDLRYEANPSHALCSLELEHTWLLFIMMNIILFIIPKVLGVTTLDDDSWSDGEHFDKVVNISTTNRWQQWWPGRRSEQRRCLCQMHYICCLPLSRIDLV